MFPTINHINDVLPHIEGNDNFSVNKKDDYIVIDYILNTPDMFNNPYQKECRGIIFYKDGSIMSRRLHKFFNVNEREESRIENIDFSEPHSILEKLDGSMVTPIFTNGKWTWGSKAGVTFLTPMIEEFVNNNKNYQLFFDYVVKSNPNQTFIFEFCSRKNRIVIDYPKDRLVLIAVRWNESGVYLNYDVINDMCSKWNIECVQQYEGTLNNMQHLVEITKDLSGVEGFVVRFNNGHMVKVKADEYVRFHRAKDDFLSEKTIIHMICDNSIDDFKSLLQEEDRKKLEKFEEDFQFHLFQTEREIFHCGVKYNHKTMTRKEFALNHLPNINKIYGKFIFSHFDDNAIKGVYLQELLQYIKQNCNNNKNLENVRSLFGNIKWENYLFRTGENNA